MRKILKYLGSAIILGSVVAMIWHRFSYPDFTQVRWFLDFWFVWVAWFVCMVLGYFLYLVGIGSIFSAKAK